MYEVTEDTLDRLADYGLGQHLHAGAALALFGILMSALVVRMTLSDAVDTGMLNVTICLLVVMSFFLGALGVRDYRSGRRELERIKNR